MIPEIGGWELLVLGALALVVVGPKDLPKLMRTVGQWLGKARGLARDFQRSIDDMARESELEELRDTVNELDPRKDLAKTIDAFDDDPTGGKTPAPKTSTPKKSESDATVKADAPADSHEAAAMGEEIDDPGAVAEAPPAAPAKAEPPTTPAKAEA